ncbi:MAG: ChaB family protein [Methanobacterium sp.]
MPYKNKNDLPKQVTENLPEHGQEIYLKAFNNAWEQYKEPKERRGNESREQVSHKVAWSAVENVYKKDKSGNWVEKKE